MRSPCPPFDLFRHVLITGSTGSGKTVSVVLPLLARALALEAADPARKSALLVVDVKGDLTMPVRRLAAAHGRSGDLIEVAVDSPDATDLIAEAGRDPFSGSQMLSGANWSRASSNHLGGDNAYWEIGAVGYVASALAWLRLLGLPCTPAHLDAMLQSNHGWTFGEGRVVTASIAAQIVQRLRSSPNPDDSRLGILLNRLVELQTNTDSKTRQIFNSILSQIIEPMAHPIGRVIASPTPTWTPASWLREGKILILRLPFVTEPGPSNYVGRMLKLSLQRLVLSRASVVPEVPHRPAFFFVDEAHRFLTADQDSGDQYFVDRCRSMRTGCVYATQSIAALRNVMKSERAEEFLANLGTRVFGRSLDTPTAQTAAELLGDVDLITDYHGFRFQLSPDPDPEVPPQPTIRRGEAYDSLRLSPTDLAKLRIGEFFVAEGAQAYRWEAELDPAFASPEMQAINRPPEIPAWQAIPALAAFASALDWNRPAPASKPPTTSPPATRPAWLPPRAIDEDTYPA